MKNKKFRQGQTVYFIDIPEVYGSRERPCIKSWFLHSQKTPLPQEGFIIDKMPVDYANNLALQGFMLYTSRRKARSALREVCCA